MSQEIDSRVVELRFDNKDFEKNTKDSIDSLNKLDKSVDQLGSNKGISNLQQSVNSFSMDDIAEAAELIKKRFSTLGIIGMSVMNRLTNSVMNFAHSAIEMFSPFSAMKDGFAEYELQINSVQTMLANYNSTAMDTAQIASNYMGEQLEQLRDITGSVINGDWGNGQQRYDLLTAAGYNYEEVQSAVNTVMWAEGTIEDNLAKLDGTVTRTGQNVSDTTANTTSDVVDNTSAALAHVETVLEDLNTYADKTVYKFGDMTNAIGTFMTAGVDLDTAAMDVKGLSNLAAAVGANNEQLQRSMYMLSQGIAAGKISLLQWRSLERTAGMGGKMFQEALKKTAREHGIAVDAMIKKNGSFRDSLKEDWLTSDIMNETLKKFTTNGLIDYFAKGSNVKGAETNIRKIMKETDKLRESAESDAEIAEIAIKQAKKLSKYTKLSESEVQSYLHQALKMEDAATKVKTFSQLIDVIREELGTGWATTWKHIIGNFEEAKKLWTKVSKAILPIIDGIADARNEMFRVWKEKGGRDDLIESMRNLWHALKSFVKPIHDAFREIFPRTTGEQLAKLTKRIKEFTATLVINEKHQNAIKGIFKGVFTIIKGILKVITTAIKIIAKVIWALAPLGKFIIDIVGGIGHLISGIGGLIKKSHLFQTAVKYISKGLSLVHKGLSDFVTWVEKRKIWKTIYDGVAKVGNAIGKKLTGLLDRIKKSDAFQRLATKARAGLDSISKDAEQNKLPKAVQFFITMFNKLKNSKFGQWCKKLGASIKSSFAKIPKLGFVQWLKDVFSNLKNNGLPAAINGIAKAFTKLKDLIVKAWKKIKEVLGFGDKSKGGAEESIEKIAKASESASEGISKMAGAFKGVENTISGFKGFADAAAKWSPKNIEQYFSKENAKKIKEKAKTFLTSIYEFIKGDADKIDLDRILDIGKGLGFTSALFWGSRRLKNGKGMNLSGISGIFDNFNKILANTSSAIAATTRVLDTFQNTLRAKMIRDIALAVLILAGAVALIAMIPAEKLWGAVGAVGALTGMIIGVYAAIVKLSAGLSTKAIVAISITLGLLAFVLIGLGIAALGVAASIGILVFSLGALLAIIKDYREAIKNDPEGIFLGIKAVGMVIKMLSGYLMSTFIATKHGGAVAIALLALVASLWLLFKILKMYASMPADEFESASKKMLTVVQTISTALQTLFLAAVFVGGFKMIGISAAMLALVFVLGRIISAIEKLGDMDPGTLERGMERVSTIIKLIIKFIRTVALSLFSTKGMFKGNPFKAGTASTGQLFGIAFVLGVLGTTIATLAGVIEGLAIMSPAKIAKGMAFISVIMAELAGFIIIVSRLSKKTKLLGIAAVLNAVMFTVAAFTVIVMLLASMKWKSLLKGVTFLGIILVELGALLAMAKFNSDPKSLLTLTALTIGVTSIVMSLVELSKLPFGKILASTLGLSAILISLGTMVKFAGKGFNIKDIVFLGAMIAGVVVVAWAIKGLASLPIENMIATTTGLGALFLAIAGAVTILDKFNVGPTAAAKAALTVDTFLFLTLGIFDAVAAVATLINGKSINENVDAIFDNLEHIFGGLGRLIGAFKGELKGAEMEHISKHLDEVGANLDKFTEKIGPFFEVTKNVDTTKLSDISASLDMITDAMQLISTWAPEMDITPQLEIFNDSIVPLGNSLVTFSDTVKDVNVDAVNAASAAMDAISKIDTSKAAKRDEAGNSAFTDLKDGLEQVADGIVSFSDKVSGKNIDLDAIQNAIDAMNLIIGVDTSKGKEPLAFWNSSELEGFGNGLRAVGLGIVDFSKDVSADGAIDNDAVDKAVKALNAITGLKFSNFKNKASSNFYSFLTRGIGGLGAAITEFSRYVSQKGAIDLVAINTAVSGINAIATINLSKYDAINAEAFGSNLILLGNAISLFSADINGLDLTTLGAGVKTFIDSITSTDLSTATTILEGFAVALESAGTQAAGNFGAALNPTVASTTVVNFCMAALSTLLQLAGVAPTYALKFALGISIGFTNGQSFVKLAAEALAKSGSDGVNNKYDAFVSSGKYLAQGLAQGLNSPEAVAKVIVAAQALAKIAHAAFDNASQIESPSKLFARSGMYLVLGLAKGMLDNADSAAEASKTLSDMVFAGFDQAMFDDIDPNPTIRPVLDLSSVQSGARTLSSLLGGYAPYTSFGLAGSISSGMLASEIQNGKKIYDNSSNVYNVTVNGAEGQDVNALADAVVNKIITVNKRKAAMNG